MRKMVSAIALFFVASLSQHSNAGLITVSSVTPVLDGADIAMLDGIGQFDPEGDQGHVWSNRPVQGQSFTTGSNSAGYLLNAVTLQNEENNISFPTATFTVRIGSIVGNQFSAIRTETSSAPVSGYFINDYISFVFDSPVSLAANTLYGFDWGSSGSGFTTWVNVNGKYSGGEAYSSGGNSTPAADNSIVFRGVDRIFHADLTAVPAPATLVLFSIGFAGLGWSRRKKA